MRFEGCLESIKVFNISNTKGFLSYSSSQMRRVWKGIRGREGMRWLFEQAVNIMYYITIVECVDDKSAYIITFLIEPYTYCNTLYIVNSIYIVIPYSALYI